jgi:hypothetical protein
MATLSKLIYQELLMVKEFVDSPLSNSKIEIIVLKQSSSSMELYIKAEISSWISQYQNKDLWKVR